MAASGQKKSLHPHQHWKRWWGGCMDVRKCLTLQAAPIAFMWLANVILKLLPNHPNPQYCR